MTISLLFSALIFSVIIFVKGLGGFPLDIIHTLGFVAAYSIPVFILEMLVRKLLERQADNKKIYSDIFLRSLWVAVLSAFLWIIAIVLFSRPQQGEDTIIILLYTPFVYIILFILNLIISLAILWLKKKKESHSLRKASIVVLSISLILLIYGGWMLAKCDGMGCVNKEYLVARAVRENNSSVCKLDPSTAESAADRGIYRSIHTILDLLAPSEFHGKFGSDCYDELAEKTNNAELCEMAGDMRNDCYQTLAENLINPLLCDKIDNDDLFNYLKDHCFNSLAEKTKNVNLCNKISDSELREWCKSRIK